MRMFLTGEGPTDCGREQFDRRTGQNIWEDGPVQIYIRKIDPTIQIDTYEKHKLRDASSTRKTRRNQRSIRGLEGHGEKAFFVAQLATEMGYDIAAMYLSRILETCGVHSSQANFVSIADASAIETLCKTCPISFADFAAQLSTYT